MQPQTAVTTKKTAKPNKTAVAKTQKTAITEPTVTPSAQNKTEEIRSIDLSLIDPSPNNSRRFDQDEELETLAESIKRHGVMQPITVRTVGERFEIVFGERRFRASIIAESTTICAIVKTLDEVQAMELTVIENLHRRQLSPVEEAAAFGKLMHLRGYSIEELAIQCGMSDSYVRTRLQLRNLIEDVSLLLRDELITLGIALELSRFPQQLQQQVYGDHLAQNNETSWRTLHVKEFRDYLQRSYSTDLMNFPFDKKDCAACGDNTARFDLFACQENRCGNCLNPTCLMGKQAYFMIGQCKVIALSEPLTNFSMRPHSEVNPRVIEELESLGYDIVRIDAQPFPQAPREPIRGDIRDEEWDPFVDDYQKQVEHYNATLSEIDRLIEEGGAIKLFDISGLYPAPCLMMQAPKAPPAKATASKTTASKPVSATRQQAEESIEKLLEKDRRNKELSIRKTVEGVREILTKAPVSGSGLNNMEQSAMYFIMLGSVRKEHFDLMGVNGDSHEAFDQWKYSTASNLTPEQKAVVCRDFIIKTLCEAKVTGPNSEMLIALATVMAPEQTAAMRSIYDKEYMDSRTAIEERIAKLMPIADSVATDTIEIASEGITGNDEPENDPAEYCPDSEEYPSTEEYTDPDDDHPEDCPGEHQWDGTSEPVMIAERAA